MNRLAIITVFAVALLAGLTREPEPARFPATDVEIIDGDTVAADVHLPWHVTLSAEHIRALDYDAWETTKRRQAVEVTDAEIVKGKIAKAALGELFAGHDVYVSPDGSGTRDNYGRLLARLWVRQDSKWVEVSKYMKDGGHCRE